MTGAALNFNDNDQIGRVAGVDTSRVAIDVTNSEMLTRVGIGQLIVIRDLTQAEFLIAMADRVTRSLREELPDPADGEFGTLTVPPLIICKLLSLAHIER